jgi:hypothetical protein
LIDNMTKKIGRPAAGSLAPCLCFGQLATIWKSSMAIYLASGGTGLPMSEATASTAATIWPKKHPRNWPPSWLRSSLRLEVRQLSPTALGKPPGRTPPQNPNSQMARRPMRPLTHLCGFTFGQLLPCAVMISRGCRRSAYCTSAFFHLVMCPRKASRSAGKHAAFSAVEQSMLPRR